MREVLGAFLRLGLTSFGGPVAHLAYFRRAFVERLGWLDDASFARLVAFCSVLPGPTSSQVGMLIGLRRAGPAGALAAWLAFTTPSALLLGALGLALAAVRSGTLQAPGWTGGALAGLHAAVAGVIAQAVVALARGVLRGPAAIGLGAGAALLTLALPPGWQWLPIVAGGLAGSVLLAPVDVAEESADELRVPRALSLAGAVVVAATVVALALPARDATGTLIATLLRAGSLVFGGGHVILPLLVTLVGIVPGDDFFRGYGAAQAVPGPLNTFAAFVGADNVSPLHGAWGAAVATVLIFTPSFGLIFAIAPVWTRLRRQPRTGRALRGAGAAAVGVLAATLAGLVPPLLADPPALVVALGVGAALISGRVPPVTAVAAAAIAGALTGLR